MIEIKLAKISSILYVRIVSKCVCSRAAHVRVKTSSNDGTSFFYEIQWYVRMANLYLCLAHKLRQWKLIAFHIHLTFERIDFS